eukprot:2726345-Rhodomonas_salina.1
MLDGESFLAILHDDNQEPCAHNILALTLDQHHFMTPTNCYSWMIDFLHYKVEEFANVDAAIYFGLPQCQHQSVFSDLELEQ